MNATATDETVAQARDRYLAASGLGDGGYDDAWVFSWLGWLPVAFPNTAGRKKAIRAHDLHHVATGYDAVWKRGEIDVSAWELGSGGCGPFALGWWIILSLFALGLVVRPRGAFRAFVRGRGARNLFGTTVDASIDGLRLGELRARLGVGSARAATRADALAFALWAPVAVVVALGPPAAVVVAIVAAIRA
jgi:hypothetical protein